jgi:predicted nucleic acid-binding protein
MSTRHLFFDTSALVKYIHEEAGSEQVIDLIENDANSVCISELAQVELVSALHRKRREGALSDLQLRQALSGVDEMLASFRVEPLHPRVLEVAVERLREHGTNQALRTLDALHLATFALVSAPNWQFVVADNRLYDIVVEEGITALHPVRGTE